MLPVAAEEEEEGEAASLIPPSPVPIQLALPFCSPLSLPHPPPIHYTPHACVPYLAACSSGGGQCQRVERGRNYRVVVAVGVC